MSHFQSEIVCPQKGIIPEPINCSGIAMSVNFPHADTSLTTSQQAVIISGFPHSLHFSPNPSRKAQFFPPTSQNTSQMLSKASINMRRQKNIFSATGPLPQFLITIHLVYQQRGFPQLHNYCQLALSPTPFLCFLFPHFTSEEDGTFLLEGALNLPSLLRLLHLHDNG